MVGSVVATPHLVGDEVRLHVGTISGVDAAELLTVRILWP